MATPHMIQNGSDNITSSEPLYVGQRSHYTGNDSTHPYLLSSLTTFLPEYLT